MGDAAEHPRATIDADLVAAQFEVLDSVAHRAALLEALRARDAYRKLIDQLNEKIAKLEQGLIGPKSERFKGDPEDPQLSIQILAQLLGKHDVEGADAKDLAQQLIALTQEQAAAGAGDGGGEDGGDGGDEKVHRRPHKPTGRSTAREQVQKLTMELVPEEVKRLGLEAFERIGEETSTTVERRVSALVEVTVVRPKFRAKTEAAVQAVKAARAGTRDAAGANAPELDHGRCLHPSFRCRGAWPDPDCSRT